VNVFKFKATVTYDGTGFHGWQRQVGGKTIQSEIEQVLLKIFQQQVKIQSSGRTDSGVHATRHVISFCLLRDMSPEKIKNAMNALLPAQIRIKEVLPVRENFHPRYDAKKKVYRYLITNFNSPFLINKAWNIPETLNLKEMKKAASYITGTHDFTSFQASGRPVKNPVRTIEYIKIRKEKFCIDPEIRVIVIEICGTGFLYKMVRNIVGTLVDVGRGKILPSQIKQIIDGRDRKLASATAPSCGLYLSDVIYGDKK
jgi:tRNA pseudouridine38-40 synthase